MEQFLNVLIFANIAVLLMLPYVIAAIVVYFISKYVYTYFSPKPSSRIVRFIHALGVVAFVGFAIKEVLFILSWVGIILIGMFGGIIAAAALIGSGFIGDFIYLILYLFALYAAVQISKITTSGAFEKYEDRSGSSREKYSWLSLVFSLGMIIIFGIVLPVYFSLNKEGGFFGIF